MDAVVVYNDVTGLVESPGMYLQFDDAADTRVAFVEGTGSKKRRYYVTKEAITEAELANGRWLPTVRLGDIENPTDTDQIIGQLELSWPLIGGKSGGGFLKAKIGVVSLSDDDFLEIVQGEEKSITFIVEPHGRFDREVFEAISVKFKDPSGNVITKTEEDEDEPIERVCEQLDVQVFRLTLSESDTQELTEGLSKIEIAFDTQKARLTHSLKMIEQIGD